jgi:UDP-glucose 4-epimerase
MTTTVCVIGGAGFIGSHLVEELLKRGHKVHILDNLKTGRVKNIPKEVKFYQNTAADPDALVKAMWGCDQIFHLAANADISKAETDPGLDFWEGTFLTHQVIMAAIKTGVKKITFTSSGGVYGNPRDTGSVGSWNEQDFLQPIAMYSAAKAAGEMEICAWANMFKGQAKIFRFANVVGPRQSHGVCLEFVKRFKENPNRTELLINGDGNMRRHYVHAKDVVDAMLFVPYTHTYQVLNIATIGMHTVNFIAKLVCEIMNKKVTFLYRGGKIGWNGDQEITFMNPNKIKEVHGWSPKYSGEDALRDSIEWLAKNV